MGAKVEVPETSDISVTPISLSSPAFSETGWSLGFYPDERFDGLAHAFGYRDAEVSACSV
jgi:hypothetical protein